MRTELAERNALDVAQQAGAVDLAIAGADANRIFAFRRQYELREDIRCRSQMLQRLVLQVEHAVGDADVGDLEHEALALGRAQAKVAVELGGQRPDVSGLDAVMCVRDGARFF